MKALPLFLILLMSCQIPKVEDDFDISKAELFKEKVTIKYGNYFIINMIGDPLDFIAIYSSLCHIDSFRNNTHYEIVQSQNLIDTSKTDFKNSLYYELIRFRDSNILNEIVEKIIKSNCIDPANIKIHRIYRIDRNTIICLNYLDPDVGKFENIIISAFKKQIKIEVVNASY